MDALWQLWDSLTQLFWAVWDVLVALGSMIVPLLPLIGWIAFWLFAVNWLTFRQTLLRGGWIGLLLIAFVWILVWGVVSPPLDGTHRLFGLVVSNFVGKTVYVTILLCIMFLAGSVQLSGGYMPREDEPPDEDHAHHAPAHH